MEPEECEEEDLFEDEDCCEEEEEEDDECYPLFPRTLLITVRMRSRQC